MSEKQQEEEQRQPPFGADRTHFEGLGDQWAVLVGNPAALMPQIVATVLQAGGMRPSWHRTDARDEYVLMAWPEKEPARAAVLMHGQPGEQLNPATAVPLLEGLPNDLTVDDVHVWERGMEANVAVSMIEGRNPMWFYDPLYFRDREDLTPGVTHTFLISGLAYGVRRALLDEMTITQGPHFEAYAAAWREEHPDADPLEMPPLKVNLVGKHLIMPGRNFCEYQMRATVVSVETTHLDKEEIYILRLRFGFDDRPPLNLALYAPRRVCVKGYEPKSGDEIDAYVWLQGRIADYVADPESGVGEEAPVQ